jgi:DNA-binding winged helix-turn-helix (wHTH) protein
MIRRFGVFEADLSTSELRKHGVPVRLQEQPARILKALLERPGQIVPRQDLIRLLWPDGTYVDYDHGLNAAINRLRQALSDSADHPRYVETVARRGYRFISPVEPVELKPPERRSQGSLPVGWALAGACMALLVGLSTGCPHRPAEPFHRDAMPLSAASPGRTLLQWQGVPRPTPFGGHLQLSGRS